MRGIGVFAIGLLALFTVVACAQKAAAGQKSAESGNSPQQVVAVAPQLADTETPAQPSRNVALSGAAHVSAGGESSHLAIDGSEETFWSAQGGATQWFQVALDDIYAADRIELVVTQAPAGRSTHEVWLGNESGVRTLFTRLADVFTEDGQTLVLSIEPTRMIDDVLVLTRDSPSWVAWREIRVFGSPPTNQLNDAEKEEEG